MANVMLRGILLALKQLKNILSNHYNKGLLSSAVSTQYICVLHIDLKKNNFFISFHVYDKQMKSCLKNIFGQWKEVI